jgi:hypothetical protein
MPKDKEGQGGDNRVGYGRPPPEHRFKKGKSGNSAGRPPKRKRKPIDVAAILNQPLEVKSSGVRRKMTAFEVAVRRLVERGLKQKNLNATLEFLRLCESHRLMVPPPVDKGGGVVVAPKGVDFHAWLESVTELVPVSSPDDDDFD